jgi:hypothetical protein
MGCSSMYIHQLHILLGGSSLVEMGGFLCKLGLLWTSQGVITLSPLKCGTGKCVVEAMVEGTHFVWYIYCDSGEPLSCIRRKISY